MHSLFNFHSFCLHYLNFIGQSLVTYLHTHTHLHIYTITYMYIYVYIYMDNCFQFFFFGTSFRTILDFYKTYESRPICDLCLVSPVIVICLEFIRYSFRTKDTPRPRTQLFRNCAIWESSTIFGWLPLSLVGNKSSLLFIRPMLFLIKVIV